MTQWPMNVFQRAAMLVTTFLFAITWQFNQYILLLQAASVCALHSVGLLSSDKVNCRLLVKINATLKL
jgi:hypothetical protein